MAAIELSAYIEALREEIQRSITKGASSELRFYNDKIELEVDVALETHVGAKGEIKFKFLIFDAKTAMDGSTIIKSSQKLKLSLVPAYKDQETGVWISGTGEKLAW